MTPYPTTPRHMDFSNLNHRVGKAVARYWSTRRRQATKQGTAGQRDQGARSAVTGGAQMDGFVALMAEVIVEAGIHEKYIFHNTALELPGFFRPTKEWNFLVARGS